MNYQYIISRLEERTWILCGVKKYVWACLAFSVVALHRCEPSRLHECKATVRNLSLGVLGRSVNLVCFSVFLIWVSVNLSFSDPALSTVFWYLIQPISRLYTSKYTNNTKTNERSNALVSFYKLFVFHTLVQATSVSLDSLSNTSGEIRPLLITFLSSLNSAL